MGAAHSQQSDIARFNESIQGLKVQISEISKRLAQVEETTEAYSSAFKRSESGNAMFLGTKFQKPEVAIDAVQTSQHGQFLGNNYNLVDTKVEMTSDGTKRTFFGRKFFGKKLKR